MPVTTCPCHRDRYVTINWGNIRRGTEGNFEKKNPSEVLTHGNYDYGSVMHYSRCGFSDNGYETISVKVHQHLPNFCKILSFLSFQGSATIGQRTGMSQTDVNKLMSFYGCWAEAPRVFNAKIKVCERASSASTIQYVCVSGLLALSTSSTHPQIYLIYVSHIQRVWN